jgi:hypothetical protein
MSDKGKCEHCSAEFEYRIVHTGFNESGYAYCGMCGRTADLDGWKFPKGTRARIHQAICREAEDDLEPCECGGRYQHGASPRCTKCGEELSAELAARWIEANAAATADGWRWQRNWTGVYMIYIDGRITCNNWKQAHKAMEAPRPQVEPLERESAAADHQPER